MKKYLFTILAGILVVGGVVLATDVIQNFYGKADIVINDGENTVLGGFYSPDITGILDNNVVIRKTDRYATSTLFSFDTGTTYLLSASGTTINLPAAEDGLKFVFRVNNALDTATTTIDSSEGDNIEGTLIANGAVIDCDLEDQINIGWADENIGDYVELFSDGTNWYLGDSGFLSAGAVSCTDPS